MFPKEGETWSNLIRRIQRKEGNVLLILSGSESDLVKQHDQMGRVLTAIQKLSSRVRIASKQKTLVLAARERGIRVIDSIADLRSLVQGHPSEEEAIARFSPALWQQTLRTRLQSVGLLTLPKLRVWLLIAVSVLLFLFVVLKLLPSATVTVWPRQETSTHTANIFLVASGSTVELPPRVRTLPLIPIEVTISKTITFDQVSAEFIGTPANVAMTFYNNADEVYSLRKGTRLQNEAGMIFRIEEGVQLAPNGGSDTVVAVADDLDLYGEIIGTRGNVPAGLKWTIPGLSYEEQKLVYAQNPSEGIGGSDLRRTVLKAEDLAIAKVQIEDELLAEAKGIADERRQLMDAQSPTAALEMLYYDELTKVEYGEMDMPTEFIGEPVASVPIEGTVTYIAYAYDSQQVLEILSSSLQTHVEEGKRLLQNTLVLDRLIAHVIDYDDDLSWIKLTVDLAGTEEFVLDPLSVPGATFGQRVREMVIGKDRETAERIVKNLPEVHDALVTTWPPWQRLLPTVPAHIQVEVVAS